MKQLCPPALRRFWAREDGSMLVSYSVWLGIFLALIVSTIELGFITARKTVLERSLDQTVRELRLSSAQFSADDLKQKICDRATILSGCLDTLHLEMISLDLRDWREPPHDPSCRDTSTNEVTPMRNFDHGDANEMMLIRACYLYQPITPGGMTLGAFLEKNAQGYAAMVSTSAFVHEPNS